MKKLAIITTHPIQYNAPFFKLLTERAKVQLKVFYTWPQAIEGFDDPDFGTKVKWDIPLLEGYDWEAVTNVAKNPSSKKWSGIDCPELINKIKGFKPNAVMVYGWNLKSHFSAIRYFKGKVAVWFFGDSTLLDEKPGLKKILRRLWLTWVYRNVDKAFYVGTNNKKYFEAHGIKANKLGFFPHAVDNDRFEDNSENQYEKKAQEWRKELNYKESDIVVLFAGKLEPKKDPLILLDAMKQIHKSTDLPLYLLFVGTGPLESELKEKAKSLNYVNFLPFQNQSVIPVVYRIGNIFCLPSFGPGETWGLAVNEAFASGRPVLVSDKVGCSIDLVNARKTGEVFKFGSLPDLCENLLSLSKNLTLYKRTHFSDILQIWNYKVKCKSIETALAELG